MPDTDFTLSKQKAMAHLNAAKLEMGQVMNILIGVPSALANEDESFSLFSRKMPSAKMAVNILEALEELRREIAQLTDDDPAAMVIEAASYEEEC